MAQHHVVAQGECLSSIARAYGFQDYRVLYDHPSNANLKKSRPNPNILLPGDVVVIPDPKFVEATKSTGQWHEIKVKREKPRLRVRLLDVERKPLANTPYTLEVHGKQRFGTTDGNGLVNEPVPAGTRSALVTVKVKDPETEEEAELSWRLQVGALDPAAQISGAQGRLRNLGMYLGPLDGELSDETRYALLAFQRLHKLEESGALDEATARELEKQHDTTG